MSQSSLAGNAFYNKEIVMDDHSTYPMSKEYGEKHRFCPKCGCICICQELACACGDKNTNGARCRCGWKGIVHDLLEKRPEVFCNCDRCIELYINE